METTTQENPSVGRYFRPASYLLDFFVMFVLFVYSGEKSDIHPPLVLPGSIANFGDSQAFHPRSSAFIRSSIGLSWTASNPFESSMKYRRNRARKGTISCLYGLDF